MKINCITYCLSIHKDDLERLRQVAEGRGWTAMAAFQDDPLTAPGQRVGLTAVGRLLKKGEVQALVVPSLAALGDTLDTLVRLIAKVVAANAALLVIEDGIDTSTTKGAAWLATVASLAEHRQAIRKQKARAGQIRAKNAGVHCGRPTLSATTIGHVRLALASGNGIRPTARKLQVSPARVALEKAAMANGQADRAQTIV